ncbi:SAM-dependent methyltransferase [Saccharothrix obliqua]|uniref:SAM-dependent methyltransferase n=1 Tax=Saccharothrix obliqua TaxID=2861747 RepID=UPI001C5F4247|nr:SAM-dependent methyltransferase [Saccharothrix obliqua]MBW4720422.1 SAM-dependent methyltransferase [Saccharothrix obliqua]
MPQDSPEPGDFDHPNPARVHDWLLGGTLNTPVDRDTAALAEQHLPGLAELTRRNRAFLHRAVRHLLDRGVRQFLDLGSGLPTAEPTHHVTRRHGQATRVVYVDHDPVTVAHARLILEDSPAASVVAADLRDPRAVLAAAPGLDPTRPLGVLAVDVLDALPDAEHLPAAYLSVAPPGSAFALTHLVGEDPVPGPLPRFPRPLSVLTALLSGLSPVTPGLVPPWEWRPEVGAPHRLPPALAAVCTG